MHTLDSLPLRVREGVTPQVPDKTKRITGKQDFNGAKKKGKILYFKKSYFSRTTGKIHNFKTIVRFLYPAEIAKSNCLIVIDK